MYSAVECMSFRSDLYKSTLMFLFTLVSLTSTLTVVPASSLLSSFSFSSSYPFSSLRVPLSHFLSLSPLIYICHWFFLLFVSFLLCSPLSFNLSDDHVYSTLLFPSLYSNISLVMYFLFVCVTVLLSTWLFPQVWNPAESLSVSL